MDNPGFVRQEEGLPSMEPSKISQKNPHSSVENKKYYWSMMRIFLACFLACLITTAIGVLILALVYVGQYSPRTGQDTSVSTTVNQPSQNNVDSRFNFLNNIGKTKVFTFQGGSLQWARYRNNPNDYSTEAELKFGVSINKHQAKMTLGILRIFSQGMKVPHWHLNANEHGYLLQGKAWIGIVEAGGSTVTTFNVSAGQVVFFPKNVLHWVKSVGDEDCVIISFFTTHDELKTLDVDDAFFGTPEDILSRALKPEGGVQFIRTFKKPIEDQSINLPTNLKDLVNNASYDQSANSSVWKYFYDLKGSKEFIFPGGKMQWARYRKNGVGLNENEKIYSESLNQHADTLTLGTLRIFSNGLRVPHFHFNAHEMGYVISGCGQIGIVGDEPVQEFSVGIGDVFFFPIGTQHYIKSTCSEDLLMITASTTGNQLETLDMDDYFHGTSDHILAQLFLKKQEEFKKIPVFTVDQSINQP
ncbi:uncharacterized protein LOC108695867 [Xenopus laevis]|uniref:Cupin type-1 domain-containing protein n=2 Tax=Xenopus laevis TaxID=8355 RepID=A0A974I691_XENLA|nr:uncharacterized protein LOC108695867 [Xenopus laevis]OCU02662.1 hypothetical protein XELAEV_18008428mg [Xenopus laevis]